MAIPAYQVLNIGFASMEAPDIEIDELGYQLSNAQFASERDASFVMLTDPASIASYNAQYPGLNLGTSDQYLLCVGDEIGNPPVPGYRNYLPEFELVYSNKAHDQNYNYDVKIYFNRQEFDVPTNYTLPFIILLRVRSNGQFEIYGGRHYTTASGIMSVGKSMYVDTYILRNGSEVLGKTATMSFADLDTGDQYAAYVGDPDTYGNNYHAHDQYIWEHQEAWEAIFHGGEKFYTTPNTWLTYKTTDLGGLGQIRFGNTIDADCQNNDCTVAYNITIPSSARFTTSQGSLRLFAPLKCYIVASAGAGGTITLPGSTAYDFGDTATYTITPSDGYAITEVTVDGVSVGAVDSYTFSNIQEDHEIVATFVPLADAYIITATAEGHGTITDEGDSYVATGADKTYVMKADTGYRICLLKVDGVTTDISSTYTFTNVTANHTIEVRYAKEYFGFGACCDDFITMPPIDVCDVQCTPTPGECDPDEDCCDKIEDLENDVVSLQSQINTLAPKTNTAYNRANAATATANAATATANDALSTANGIAATANQALVDAAAALAAVNGLVIGGTQLLRNTYDMATTSDQTADGALQTSNVTTGGTTYLHRPVGYYNNTGGSYTNILSWRYIYCELGQTYTMSFYIKSTSAQTENVGVYFAGASGYTQVDSGITSQGKTTTANNGLVYIDTTANWQRVWVKWTLKTSGNTETYKQAVIRVLAGADAYVSGVKLEKGNIPTDWDYNHKD